MHSGTFVCNSVYVHHGSEKKQSNNVTEVQIFRFDWNAFNYCIV